MALDLNTNFKDILPGRRIVLVGEHRLVTMDTPNRQMPEISGFIGWCYAEKFETWAYHRVTYDGDNIYLR